MAVPSQRHVSEAVNSTTVVQVSRPQSNPQSLPAGGCRYTSLEQGGSAPTCGCQRFFLRINQSTGPSPQHGKSSLDQRNEWCMCGHHSCFHLRGNESQQSSLKTQLDDGETTKPREVDQSRHHRRITHDRSSATPNQRKPVGQSSAKESRHLSQDGIQSTGNKMGTRDSSAEANDDALLLPPIPSQCLLSSQGSHHRCSFRRSGCSSGQIEVDLHNSSSHKQFSGLGLMLTRKDESVVIERSSMPDESSPSREKLVNVPSLQSHSVDGSEPCEWYRAEDSALNSKGGDSFAQYDILSGFKDNQRDLSVLLPDLDKHSYANDEDTADDNMQSATEVVTPSLRGTPDLRALGGFDRTITSLHTTISDLRKEVNRAQDQGPRSMPNPLPDTWNDDGRSKSSRSPAEGFSSALVSPTGKRYKRDSVYIDGLVSTLRQLVPQLDYLVLHLRAHPAVENILRGLSHRVEVLENPSFSMGHLEELPDKLELFDGRITEVEGSVDELMKWRANLEEDVSSVDRHREKHQINGAQLSMASEISSHSNSPSAMIAAALGRTSAHGHIQTLEARVASLEAGSMPSFRQPWTMEVILIPWGRHLRGLWYPADHYAVGKSQQGTGDNETPSHSILENSQELSSQKKPTPNRTLWDSAAIRKWATDADTWLMAKACGSNSKVYKRLKSSGCIQQVNICGGSAKDIERAMESVLGKTLNVLENRASSQSGSLSEHGLQRHQESSLPLGLGARYIPLRKNYKVSRLQFLNPSELASSTIWNAEFLRAGAIMNPHKGLKTLFITTRESYLQSSGSNASWGWQDLKELSLSRLAELRKASPAIQHPTEEDLDDCWQWDPRLDPPLSTDSSFQSNGTEQSSFSFRSHISQAAFDEDSMDDSQSPSQYVPIHDAQRVEPISPQSEFPTERVSQRRRTTSINLGEDGMMISKRPSSMHGEISRTTLAKRRRISNSPKYDFVQSPFFDEGSRNGTSRSSHSRKRGMTPTAYATPYSGTVLMDRRGSHGDTSSGADDDDDDDDVYSGNDQATSRIAGDEAWEGVKDENTHESMDNLNDQDDSDTDDADDDLDAM